MLFMFTHYCVFAYRHICHVKAITDYIEIDANGN